MGFFGWIISKSIVFFLQSYKLQLCKAHDYVKDTSTWAKEQQLFWNQIQNEYKKTQFISFIFFFVLYSVNMD